MIIHTGAARRGRLLERTRGWTTGLARAGLALGLAFAAAAGIALAACGDDSGPGTQDAAARDAVADARGGDAAGGDANALGDAAADAAPDAGADAGVCSRVPGPADYERTVVVAHPYDANGGPADRWEVFLLSVAGELSQPNTFFQMGRAPWGQVRFTPDGQVGLVAQEDGTLGVFRVVSPGQVQVVHAGFAGSFYASDVVMDPAGDGAWVLDSQWRDNGGGIYRVAIGCDGTLTEVGLVAASKLPYGLALVPGSGGGRAVVAAKDILDSPADQDVHLLSWGASPQVLASAVAFSDDDDIVGSLAVTGDGRYALIGDNQGVFSTPNRVAVVALGASAVTPRQELSPIPDPMALLVSPFGDVVLVMSGLGDALYILDYDPGNGTAPFSYRGEVAYSGASPQLPSGGVLIARGTLEGRVVIAENTGVRMVAFRGGGVVEDLGALDLGSGLDKITGAVGVQP